jgi:hypothetical protein
VRGEVGLASLDYGHRCLPVVTVSVATVFMSGCR